MNGSTSWGDYLYIMTGEKVLSESCGSITLGSGDFSVVPLKPEPTVHRVFRSTNPVHAGVA